MIEISRSVGSRLCSILFLRDRGRTFVPRRGRDHAAELAIQASNLNGRRAGVGRLSLSGSGEDGAFDAGSLTGWSAAGTRQIDGATGVSGSLAPRRCTAQTPTRFAGPTPSRPACRADVRSRSTLVSRDLEMVTPSRASISPMRRASVQMGRSATGAWSKGAATLSAASALTGAGPEVGLVSSASTPAREKSLRHRRTVSSRTPNASAMRGLVQPDSVSNTARARSASPRSREPASLRKPAVSSSLAVTGDLPAMSHPRTSAQRRNHSQHPLATQLKPA